MQPLVPLDCKALLVNESQMLPNCKAFEKEGGSLNARRVFVARYLFPKPRPSTA